MFRILIFTMTLVFLTGCDLMSVLPEGNSSPLIERDAPPASDSLTVRTFDLSGVTQLAAAAGVDVRIRIGTPASAVLSYDKQLADSSVVVDLSAERLSVGLFKPYKYDYSGITLVLDVTVPTLAMLELRGSAQAVFERIETSDPFRFVLAGGTLAQGEISAPNVDVKLAGGSVLTLQGGQVGFLNIDATGGGVIDAQNLESTESSIKLHGGMDAQVRVDGRVDARLSGNARLRLYGQPILGDIEILGGARIDQVPD